MASKTLKTLMQFTNVQLLAELTNLRENECAQGTMYTQGGLNRLLARLKKWHGDALDDIKAQETQQATIMASKKSKTNKEGLVKESNKFVKILHDDLIEIVLKTGWINTSLDASDALAQGGRTLFGAGFGPTNAGPTEAGPTNAGPTEAGPTDEGEGDAGQNDEGDNSDSTASKSDDIDLEDEGDY